MEFIHQPYQPGETIAAIATPPGEGGIAIIRISGNRAIEVASRIFSGPVQNYLTHTAHLGFIKDLAGSRIDEGLCLVMRAPRSYTGEDIVELQCHGGMVASKKVLEAVLQAGARSATAGEFTFRAFMNGKLDLAQAEAVQRLISAKNEHAFAAAGRHLEGRLSQKIRGFQEALIARAAILEAWVDFPDEGLEFASKEEVLGDLQGILNQMKLLLETFHEGRKLEIGLNLCIAGPPNAGKSSLMNALLDQERAIVTPIAGTTRDLIQEDLILNGLHFKLMDTAGIRDTEEVVEKEGIRRSKKAIEEADLILLVLDASKPIEKAEHQLLSTLPPEKTIIVWNKIDLLSSDFPEKVFLHEVRISAKEKEGLADLKREIDQIVWKRGAPSKDEVLLSSLRHKEALQKAIQSLESAIAGLQQETSPEFLTDDVKGTLTELGRIIGTNITEDILTSIFSQFCIGK